jgi:hypothetical protein
MNEKYESTDITPLGREGRIEDRQADRQTGRQAETGWDRLN